jgi:type II secretory pathway pseudopilin PulG
MKSSTHPQPVAAFSLIEVIGVLAVFSILAAVILPNLVRKIAEANGTREEQNLAVLSRGLTDYVRTRQEIPGGLSWVSNVATFTGLNADEVSRVNPTDSNSARVYLVYPEFTPSSGSDPVLTTSSAGFVAPTNARVLFLSTTKTSLALPVSSGKASNTAANRDAFDSIWNWNFDPSTKAPPSGWPAVWNQNGEHLHVRRLNLAPFFHHLTVSNTQFPTNVPFAKFNNLATVAFDATNAVDAYYLEGTVVRLYKHDTPYAGPPANPDQLDLTHTVEADVNFIYSGLPVGWSIP